MFLEGCECGKTILFKFSFSEIWYSLSEFTSRKIVNIWQIKQVWTRAKKFEVAQIHLLCDFFAAVAFVDEGVEVELWFCYLCVLSPSLRSADAFPVVACLPPKNSVCEPEQRNDSMTWTFLANHNLALKIKELTRESPRKIVRGAVGYVFERTK